MGYHETETMSLGRLLRQTIISTLVILVAVILCSLVSVLGIDAICHNDIEKVLPYYPNADLVSQQHDFLRARAMGHTYEVLATNDLPANVRQWYSDLRLKLAKHGADDSGRNMPNGLATVSYRVAKDDVTGQTLIYLVSECAYN